jgi:glycosyltransferase involved in cell wall biosynthesis
MARIAKRLKAEGLNFVWAVWGEGRILSDLKRSVEVGGYADVFHVEGWTSSPFEKIAEADVFVLLSHYEGLPNVIYESFMCHTPVFSTDVGAIADQISSGENGWLVKDDEELIFAELKRLISTPTQIYEASHRLGSYNYDNDAVVRRHVALVGGVAR